MQTFTPTEYLQIDIASNFGLDKEDWSTRLDWFQEHEPELEKLTHEADEPAQYYAGVQAYRKAFQGGSISYPISLDATASGAQLLSVLVGCRKSAALCNVVDTGSREDLYTNIYQLMLQQINDKSKIGREDIKRSVMTSLYGSKREPKEVFGEGELLAIFYETMETKAPGIWDLNKALLSLWQPTALSHDWVLPDNFHVKNKVMDDQVDTIHFMNRPYEVTTKVNQPVESGLSIGANVVHSVDGVVVREIMRRCMFDSVKIRKLNRELAEWHVFGQSKDRPDDKMVQQLWAHYETTGFLSARILDHLDAFNIGLVRVQPIKDLLQSLPEKSFQVLAIHDCFRVHPNNANDLRRQYNQILSELASSEILASIASQIVGHPVNVTKYDDIAEDVLEADYALS